jgi:hypothetical protein
MTYYEIASDAYGRIDLRTGQLEHRARASSAIGVLHSMRCRRARAGKQRHMRTMQQGHSTHSKVLQEDDAA